MVLVAMKNIDNQKNLNKMKSTLLCVLMFCSFSVQAAFYTGNDLYQKLKAESSVERMLAAGYVVAVVDGWEQIRVCPTAGVTVSQVADIVKAYLEKNPAVRHQRAFDLTAIALGEAFPCQKK